MVNQELQFYVDTLIVETMLTNPKLVKNAQSGIVSALIHKVYDYVQGKVSEIKDSDSKVEVVVNLLVPGILNALGFKSLSVISWLAENFFHVSFAKIFETIASEVKNLIVGGKQTSSAEVDTLVSNVIESSMSAANPSDEMPIKSSKLTLREANLFKIAFLDFIKNNPDLDLYNDKDKIKNAAGLFGSSLATFVSSKNKFTKILISLIGWVVKAVLAAGGFMVAGDVVNKVLGRPSPIGGISHDSETSGGSFSTTTHTAPPNSFKVNPNYVEESNNGPGARWIIQSDLNSLENILVSWADEIYPEIKGQENLIKSASTFNAVVQMVKAYNAGGPPNMIFIPKQWKSRKQVVDQFMGEVSLHFQAKPDQDKGIDV